MMMETLTNYIREDDDNDEDDDAFHFRMGRKAERQACQEKNQHGQEGSD